LTRNAIRGHIADLGIISAKGPDYWRDVTANAAVAGIAQRVVKTSET
jgi:hypothetical protein